MSPSSANIARVSDIYAAFGRGDIPNIIEALHADVEWEFGTPARSIAIPWIVPGRGRACAVAFFEAVREHLRIEVFEVLALMGDGDIVVALVDDEEATLKRFRRKGASVALEAANPAYETRIFGPDRVRVQGRLVGLIRKY